VHSILRRCFIRTNIRSNSAVMLFQRLLQIFFFPAVFRQDVWLKQTLSSFPCDFFLLGIVAKSRKLLRTDYVDLKIISSQTYLFGYD